MILHILKYIKIVTFYLQLTTSQKSGSVSTKTYLCCKFLEYFIIERSVLCFLQVQELCLGWKQLLLTTFLSSSTTLLLITLVSWLKLCNLLCILVNYFHSTFGYFTCCQIWKVIWWHLICHYVGIFGSLKMYTNKLNISDYFCKIKQKLWWLECFWNNKNWSVSSASFKMILRSIKVINHSLHCMSLLKITSRRVLVIGFTAKDSLLLMPHSPLSSYWIWNNIFFQKQRNIDNILNSNEYISCSHYIKLGIMILVLGLV